MNWRFPSAGYAVVFLAGVLVGIVLAQRMTGHQYEAPGVEGRRSERAGKSAAPAGL